MAVGKQQQVEDTGEGGVGERGGKHRHEEQQGAGEEDKGKGSRQGGQGTGF